MPKGISRVLLGIIGVLIVAEVLALLWLYSTVSTYKNYWVKRAEKPGEITYLAFGDSAAQGIGATSPSRGYVGLIAARLQQQTGKSVRVVNLSKTGAKLQDYLNQQVPKAKNIHADVVTIEIGANDISGFEPNKFRTEFQKVLASLPPGSYVANMPAFNSRPSSTDNAKKASEIIEQEIKAYPKLHLVDLQKQTSEHGSIFGFAPDLFHPNNISYKNWADAFWLQVQANQKF